MAGDTYEAQELQDIREALGSGKVVLEIWSETGELKHVWGCAEPAHEVETVAGSWYTTGACTYVRHPTDGWRKVCGGKMKLEIRTSDGQLDRIKGDVEAASNPQVDPTGDWRMNGEAGVLRTTCIYVNHGGVWKKVCS